MAEFIMIECSHCEGLGKINLTGVYAETLDLLRKQKKAIVGADLARQSGVNVTAMANRLAWLERQGLAESERYGRARRWIAVR